MGYELGTPGTTLSQQDISYTHVNMSSLYFRFPARDQLVSAQLEWETGTLDGAGKFVMLRRESIDVPEGPTRAFLISKDTNNKSHYVKLEEAMFSYLVNEGHINTGTVVVIPE